MELLPPGELDSRRKKSEREREGEERERRGEKPTGLRLR